MKNLLSSALLFLAVAFAGMAQWSADPAQNLQITDLPGEDVIPKIAMAPNGDYYIAFLTSAAGGYNVRLQRLDNEGNPLWPENGILISDHPSMTWLTDWDATADHDNHAILTWQDIRSNGQNNVVAYRIAPDGTFVWGDDGIMLSDSPNFDVSPKVTVTAANNAVFAWQSEENIIMQKISPDGTKHWGEWGITFSGDNSHSWPQLMPVGDDDVIMKFFEDSGPAWAPDRYLKAQRFDLNGDAVWPSHTVICDHGSITAWTQILSFKSDGNEGFYIAWHDYQLSGTIASGWVQHVNAAGQVQFQANGALVSANAMMNKFYPTIAKPENDSNLYVFWNEVNGDQNQYGLHGQKISSTGDALWGDNGKVIIPVTGQNVSVNEVHPVGGDLMVFYDFGLMGLNSSLHAMRIDGNGDFVWEEENKPIKTTNSATVHLEVSGFASGQWVLAWEDNRTGTVNVFAQNMQPDGTLGIVDDPGNDYTVTFVITDAEGNGIDDAVVVLNGTENTPGDYVFTGIAPGSYDYSVSSLCYEGFSSSVTVANADLEVDVQLTGLPGDANGDGEVNVLDVIAVTNIFVGLNPEPFCFDNADMNGDGVINILDLVSIIYVFSE